MKFELCTYRKGDGETVALFLPRDENTEVLTPQITMAAAEILESIRKSTLIIFSRVAILYLVCRNMNE